MSTTTEQFDELSRSKVVTVDEVLAALVADQVTSVKIETWGAPGREHRVFVTVIRGGVKKAEQMAPTLHAALAAAVVEVELQ